MKWLVTGGCGFLGTALIRDLVEEDGHAVRVVDNLAVGTREDLRSASEFTEKAAENLGEISTGVELVEGDVRDGELALGAANGADVIVHLAANTGVGPSIDDPRADCLTNVIGTLNYLEAARHNKSGRFVFASSGAPVGEVEPPIHEELAPHPASPYGASKLSGEGYCSAYNRTFGVETVALRFGNVYGPGSGHKNSVVAKFVKRALDGEALEVYGDGTQTRDFIYIDDLIRAVRLAAVTEGVGGETFQIATNAETTVGELAGKLVPILEASGTSGVEVRRAAPLFKEVMRNYSDTSKARRMLGWRSEYKLEEGLWKTVEWFVKSEKHANF
ncbi:MAG: NAD-dependent epimerase/dehydratase family protein [Rubrobacteraceae bacterium]